MGRACLEHPTQETAFGNSNSHFGGVKALAGALWRPETGYAGHPLGEACIPDTS
jgi:hypothetical protein